MFNSFARVLTTVAPMRRPVKEPGPEKKVISLISSKVLLFSASFSEMKLRSFSARSRPEAQRYSFSSSFRRVSGELVSRYNFM